MCYPKYTLYFRCGIKRTVSICFFIGNIKMQNLFAVVIISVVVLVGIIYDERFLALRR